ncbi:AAA family ATPase [Kordiimonas sp.]|uniref:AAA family ATPase n=1 Tax=Kordiimonas sp. TaxID=1970157 RepID=UPI003A94512D
MSQTLEQIAQQLHRTDKKVQLIYAFNGTGKTRLSRTLKNLVVPRSDEGEEGELSREKILYYNAFTEDLFYWDNDLVDDSDPKLVIQPNTFTDWILGERGLDQEIIANFQRYTDDKLTPSFVVKTEQVTNKDGKRENRNTYPQVTFAFDRGTERSTGVKLSKGEESNLIWSVFFSLLKEVVGLLQEAKENEDQEPQFGQLEYVFIDDPVSSLDDTHLIELAVDLADLIKSTEADLKFIITTHNPLFYNVLHNEFGNKYYKNPESNDRKLIYKPSKSAKYRLEKKADGTYQLNEQANDAPFSYHLLLLAELKKAVDADSVQKYHFNFLRNVLEKTATFLGYRRWSDLLPKIDGNPDPFANRIVNLSSHSAHSGEEVAEIETNDKDKLRELVEHLFTKYQFLKPKAE